MNTKHIIVLIHDEQAKPFILHSDKRFHENIIERHGCHVTEYLSKAAAKKKAAQCCKQYTYGKSHAMTYGDLERLEARLQGCYAHGLRTRMIEEFLEEL
jgi:hypothetical protein